MLKFCYFVYQETTLIMGIVSMLMPIVTGILKSDKQKILMIAVSVVLSVAFITNHSNMEKYTMIPYDLVGRTYKDITDVLGKANLKCNLPAGGATAIDNQIVTSTEENEGEIVPKDTTIHLHFETPGMNSATEPTDLSSGAVSNEPANNMPEVPAAESTSNTADSTNVAKLDISIDTAQVFENGFHYEFPDSENPERTVLIDFTRGLSGTFHYSRALSAEELTSMGHGGRLYDENMNEISGGIYWSDTDGHFAIQFPEELSSGTYVYELYQVIDGQFIYSHVKFTF